MKKIFIFLFFVLSFVYGQTDKTILELTTLTAPASGDYIPIWDVSQQGTYKLSLSSLASSSLLGGAVDEADDYTWTGTHNFSSELQAPSTLSGSLSNGLGYNSGLFSWVESGAIKTGADRAWVVAYVASEGVAVDTNNFGLLAGDQTWSGSNYYSTQLAVGASTNNGALKIPVYTSTNRPTAVDGSMFYHVGENRIYVYDTSIWRPFLDSTAVASLVTTGSYLPQTGTATSLSSTLSWSSGTITPKKLSFGGHDAGRSLIMPLDKNGLVSEEEGSIYYDYDNTKSLKLYDGADWIQFQNDETINGLIEANLGSSAPTSDDGSTATISWTNKNYAQKIVGDADLDQTVTVSNYTYGWCAFYIRPNGNTTTINISGVTIQWVGDTTPTFNDGKYYEVILKYYNSTTALGSYVWY